MAITRIPEALIWPAVGISTTPAAMADIGPGQSRLGGRPDMPLDVKWPLSAKDGDPLAFIAQINLEETNAFRCSTQLPKAGWLLFFYDAERQPWGLEPDDRGAAAIIFLKPDARLVRRSIPPRVVDECRFRPTTITFSQLETVPEPWSIWVDDPGLTDRERHETFDESDFGDPWSRQQLGGHPASIQQQPMEVDCELASSGVHCERTDSYQSETAFALIKAGGARDWRLLLQVASDENARFIWGDAGCLYFWAKRQDLEVADFSTPWVMLQCS